MELEIYPKHNVENIFQKVREHFIIEKYCGQMAVYFASGRILTDGLLWDLENSRNISTHNLISQQLNHSIWIDAFEIEDFFSASEIVSEFEIDQEFIEKFQMVNYYVVVRIPPFPSRESSVAIAISIAIAELSEGVINASRGVYFEMDKKRLYSPKEFEKVCLDRKYLT